LPLTIARALWEYRVQKLRLEICALNLCNEIFLIRQRLKEAAA